MKKTYSKEFKTKWQAIGYYRKVTDTQKETRKYSIISMGFNGKWVVTWQYKWRKRG